MLRQALTVHIRSRASRAHANSRWIHETVEPFYRIPGRVPPLVSVEEAVAHVKSGSTVFLHGGSATPLGAIKALTEYGKAERLANVKLVHIHLEGDAPFLNEDCEGIFRSVSLFMGGNVRQAVNKGRADFTPVFLSEIPELFNKGVVPLDVALVQVSPPDKHGYTTLGTAVDCTYAAVRNAKRIIGVINRHMPRTHGDGMIHMSQFECICEDHSPLPELAIPPKSHEKERIGHFIAENLVQNGACLQMGIGAIPDAVLSQLGSHRDLGIHTEMMSDGVVDLVHKGVVTNSEKEVLPGMIVAGFCLGTKKLYDFIDDNPMVRMCDIGFVNDIGVIQQNNRVTAINSAVEVDLTGQIVSDSMGHRMYSGVGGQVDFIRGASLSSEGRPIIALPSTTGDHSRSRIVATLTPGGGVVTTRAHAHYIVTEYGIAQLHGRTLEERAHALISIAHPKFREQLSKELFETRHLRG